VRIHPELLTSVRSDITQQHPALPKLHHSKLVTGPVSEKPRVKCSLEKRCTKPDLQHLAATSKCQQAIKACGVLQGSKSAATP